MIFLNLPVYVMVLTVFERFFKFKIRIRSGFSADPDPDSGKKKSDPDPNTVLQKISFFASTFKHVCGSEEKYPGPTRNSKT